MAAPNADGTSPSAAGPPVPADLIEASSLGSAGARQLRARTPASQATLASALARVHNAIFFSYSPYDVAAARIAQRLRDRCSTHFGRDRVLDLTQHLRVGRRYPRIVDEAVGRSSIVVFIAGHEDQWSRLNDPNDVVRAELAAALRKDIPVLPILLGDVPMVRYEQLPAHLAALAARRYRRIQFDPGDIDVELQVREVDLEPVLSAVEALLGRSPAQVVSGSTAATGASAAVAAGAGGGGLATVPRTQTTQPRRYRRKDPVLAKELVDRYKAGESIRALAASTGHSYGFIHRALTEAKVPLRQRGGARRRKKK